jgi:hypothetical protein
MRISSWVGCVALSAAVVGCKPETAATSSAPPPSGSEALGDPGVRPAFDSSLVRYGSYYSGFDARTRLIVRDQATWESTWTQLTGAVQPKPPAPAVNFETQMVLVAAMGSRNTGGYSISIDAATENGDALLATVRETSPGNTCGTTQSITAPATATIVPRRSAVTFVELADKHEC